MTQTLIRGLLPEDPFLETYLVRPGGATVFGLAPDERMTVVDARGNQAAEVTVLGADGRPVVGWPARRPSARQSRPPIAPGR